MSGWLIALIAFGGVLVLLLLLLFLGSAGIRITADDDIRVVVSVLGFRKRLLPGKSRQESLRDVSKCRNMTRLMRREEKRRRKAEEKAEKKRLKQEQKQAKKEAQKASGVAAPNLKENLDMILALLKKAYSLTKGKVCIRFHRMHIVVATGDAANTAILYGVMVQSVAYLLQWSEDHFNRIRRDEGNMTVEPDYVASKSSIDIDLIISVRLFRAAGIGIGMLRSYLAERKRARRRAAKRFRQKQQKTTPSQLSSR